MALVFLVISEEFQITRAMPKLFDQVPSGSLHSKRLEMLPMCRAARACTIGRLCAKGGPRALAPRKDLIAEVLAERTDDDDTPSPDEPQDRPSGAYTFRGLLG